MQPIKNTVFPQSENNGYDIGSFFNGDIVEDTVIFYSTDPRFGEIEIAVNPGMKQQEI